MVFNNDMIKINPYTEQIFVSPSNYIVLRE